MSRLPALVRPRFSGAAPDPLPPHDKVAGHQRRNYFGAAIDTADSIEIRESQMMTPIAHHTEIASFNIFAVCPGRDCKHQAR